MYSSLCARGKDIAKEEDIGIEWIQFIMQGQELLEVKYLLKSLMKSRKQFARVKKGIIEYFKLG